MLQIKLFIGIELASIISVHAQEKKDTVPLLQEVVVEAFHGRTYWKDLPASIAIIQKKELRNSPTTNFIPVVNMVPGIRMEERSPGSYRLSIRGSLLRSPFGVRNLKVYWNGLPLTDGGGNTYLNLIDLWQVTGIEIVKGPVAAAYGAGTGGAVLLRTDTEVQTNGLHQFSAAITGGSFGLFQQQAAWQYANESFSNSVKQVHLQSDGYRQQSAMRRDAINWQATLRKKKQVWRFLGFYTDLYYQTPGGITETQFKQNPKLARQPAGLLPGAVQQQTAVYNKTGYAGTHLEWLLNGQHSIRSFAMGSLTSFRNPFITNYEQRAEDNIGFGTQWQYKQQKGLRNIQWNTGMEWQYQHALIDNYGNRKGIKDTVQYKDKVYAVQWFVFSQVQYQFHPKWLLGAGISSNQQLYRYKRRTDFNATFMKRQMNAVLTPRLALSYRLHPAITFYAVAAKGFSAPTLAEFRPSDGNFYEDLDAETGWNIELGWKGYLLNNTVQFDIAWYRFRLNNAIVRRNTAAGTEYFVNAGSTLQNGLEAMIKATIISSTQHFIKQLTVTSSYSYQPYTFSAYKQGNTDYSGNRLTGVPGNTWVTGVRLETAPGWYCDVILNATAAIPLNDANDAYAAAYQLLQGRTGYRKKRVEIFLGIDNALNQLYSLGNDINAAGRRFYNAAPPRNFMFGMNFELR